MVAVGQILDDASASIVEGTSILAQTSGPTGGAGTYTVSSSQTVNSETMVSVTANLDRVQMNLNQIPAISAADITVSLA